MLQTRPPRPINEHALGAIRPVCACTTLKAGNLRVRFQLEAVVPLSYFGSAIFSLSKRQWIALAALR